jgi:N utilization substance protein A
MVVNELRGEKIDIVPFSEDLPDFVAKALSPAKVSQVNISDDRTQADVIVPDHQLSLAIGREGQNARLAARLTGVRVDIRSETQVAEGVPAGGREDDVEYAEGEWVPNTATGEMEWHAADGSIMSQAEWAQMGSDAAPDEAVAADVAPDTVAAADADAPVETNVDVDAPLDADAPGDATGDASAPDPEEAVVETATAGAEGGGDDE